VAVRQRGGRDRVHPCTAVSAGGSVRKGCGDLPHSCCPLSSRPAAPVRVAKTERNGAKRSRWCYGRSLNMGCHRRAESVPF
jgi:hypothetical protein